jgi:hypothetical protein
MGDVQVRHSEDGSARVDGRSLFHQVDSSLIRVQNDYRTPEDMNVDNVPWHMRHQQAVLGTLDIHNRPHFFPHSA